MKLKAFSNNNDKNWYETFRLLLSMLRADDYRLSPSTWAVIAGALAYVVFPFDVIPDFIAGLDWLDDVFVLASSPCWMKRLRSIKFLDHKFNCIVRYQDMKYCKKSNYVEIFFNKFHFFLLFALTAMQMIFDRKKFWIRIRSKVSTSVLNVEICVMR